MECVGDEGLREEFVCERDEQIERMGGMREMSIKDQDLVF